eukprot:scaffold18803_cov53-Attheya_sp.AAC.1
MGMTGRISTPDMIPKLVELKDDSEYPPPYTHLVLKTDLAEASYSDPRKFGSVRLSTSLEDGFGELAPDALLLCGPTTTTTRLDGLVGKKMGIKGLLLDQKRVMSGIGNWVADEWRVWWTEMRNFRVIGYFTVAGANEKNPPSKIQRDGLLPSSHPPVVHPQSFLPFNEKRRPQRTQQIRHL